MNLSKIHNLTIPEGNVKSIRCPSGNICWKWSTLSSVISTGIQVIDTGVYCTENMSCEIKIAYNEMPSVATYIGAIEYSDGSYLRCHFQASASQDTIGFWQDSPTMGNVVSVAFDTEPHILRYSAKDLTVGIDDATATHGNTPPPTNSTFYLFDRNVTGFTADAEPGKCKIYYAKFWEDGELIRDFIPRLDAAGKACLFDLVNETYYYDLNGNNFNYEIKE